MQHRSVLALGMIALLNACASISVTPIENGYGSNGKAYDGGVRFYRPALHVWIVPADPSEKTNSVTTTKSETKTQKAVEGTETRDAKRSADETTTQTGSTQVVSTAQNWKAQVVVLPDFTQEYAIDWSAGVGSVTADFTLTDGWNLTGFNSTADSKASEHLAAITAVAAAAAGALTADSNWKGPGLYRIQTNTDGTLGLGNRVLSLGQ